MAWHRGLHHCGISIASHSPVAGKQKGQRWSATPLAGCVQVVREIRPRLLFLRKASLDIWLGFEQVHDDLRRLVYESVKANLFSAAEVGSTLAWAYLHSVPWKRPSQRVAVSGSEKFKERMDAGMPVSLRDQVKHLWPTVMFSSANGPCRKSRTTIEMPSGNCPVVVAHRRHKTSRKRGQFIAERTGGTSVSGQRQARWIIFCQIARAMDGWWGRMVNVRADPARAICGNRSWPTGSAGFQKQCGVKANFIAEHQAIECGSCLPFPPGPEGVGTESQPVLNP